jgi:hypothetical protein
MLMAETVRVMLNLASCSSLVVYKVRVNGPDIELEL